VVEDWVWLVEKEVLVAEESAEALAAEAEDESLFAAEVPVLLPLPVVLLSAVFDPDPSAPAAPAPGALPVPSVPDPVVPDAGVSVPVADGAAPLLAGALALLEAGALLPLAELAGPLADAPAAEPPAAEALLAGALLALLGWLCSVDVPFCGDKVDRVEGWV
jgi:hypothetical protein